MRHFVYFLQRADGDIKIGKSSKNAFQSRVRDIAKRNGQLTLLGIVDGYTEKERELHQRFIEHRRLSSHVNRQWKRAQPVEFFAAADELLGFIRDNAKPLDHAQNRFGPRRKYDVGVGDILEYVPDEQVEQS